MAETNVKTIELYSEEGLLVGSYEVKTKEDIQKVLLAIGEYANIEVQIDEDGDIKLLK